ELLDWLTEAQLDRVGCFQYEPVKGAQANDLGLEEVPAEVKQERWDRFMEHQQAISAKRLARKVGSTLDVLIDEVDGETAIGRSMSDAPEIDGIVQVKLGKKRVLPGAIIKVYIEEADAYDLTGTAAA